MRDAGLKKIVVVTDDHRDAIRKHLNLAFPNDEIRLVCSARYVKAENRESLVAAGDRVDSRVDSPNALCRVVPHRQA